MIHTQKHLDYFSECTNSYALNFCLCYYGIKSKVAGSNFYLDYSAKCRAVLNI